MTLQAHLALSDVGKLQIGYSMLDGQETHRAIILQILEGHNIPMTTLCSSASPCILRSGLSFASTCSKGVQRVRSSWLVTLTAPLHDCSQLSTILWGGVRKLCDLQHAPHVCSWRRLLSPGQPSFC